MNSHDSTKIWNNELSSESIMAEKENKFIVINKKRLLELNTAFTKYNAFTDCTPVEDFLKALRTFGEDYKNWVGKELNQEYIVCNQDEPYAEFVWQIILHGEEAKDL